MSSTIQISDWKPRKKNTLRGFCTAAYGSLIIADIGAHTKNGKSWASLPSKPMVDRDGSVLRDDAGKVRYTPVLTWKDKVSADRFSEAVIAEITRLHGAAVLDDEP